MGIETLGFSRKGGGVEAEGNGERKEPSERKNKKIDIIIKKTLDQIKRTVVTLFFSPY